MRIKLCFRREERFVFLSGAAFAVALFFAIVWLWLRAATSRARRLSQGMSRRRACG
jgi:hypothetical protein